MNYFWKDQTDCMSQRAMLECIFKWCDYVDLLKGTICMVWNRDYIDEDVMTMIVTWKHLILERTS